MPQELKSKPTVSKTYKLECFLPKDMGNNCNRNPSTACIVYASPKGQRAVEFALRSACPWLRVVRQGTVVKGVSKSAAKVLTRRRIENVKEKNTKTASRRTA